MEFCAVRKLYNAVFRTIDLSCQPGPDADRRRSVQIMGHLLELEDKHEQSGGPSASTDLTVGTLL